MNWDKAIDRIRGGWRKGGLGDWKEPEGSVCLRGAICHALGWEAVRRDDWMEPERLLGDIVREQFPERSAQWPGMPVPSFNDHPETTLDDVLLVLEKARAHE